MSLVVCGTGNASLLLLNWHSFLLKRDCLDALLVSIRKNVIGEKQGYDILKGAEKDTERRCLCGSGSIKLRKLSILGLECIVGLTKSAFLPTPGSALLSSQQCARGRSRQGCLQVMVSMFGHIDFPDRRQAIDDKRDGFFSIPFIFSAKYKLLPIVVIILDVQRRGVHESS